MGRSIVRRGKGQYGLAAKQQGLQAGQKGLGGGRMCAQRPGENESLGSSVAGVT
ncbi:hypothetical protein RchiOBHm_Chr5g0045521 [Rosa chinensis]|uniref:Uncharacterized protein n=1 Tax=Rosa chinensis TaxID=74649 RepID=A0A2P6QDV0_ROSCH|nr:hypothetical protein RchiOBHm_Chr5g0045521 [Rosa chinensis]